MFSTKIGRIQGEKTNNGNLNSYWTEDSIRKYFFSLINSKEEVKASLILVHISLSQS